MKSKSIKIPIYQAKVTIILADDLEEVSLKYKTKSLSNYGAIAMRNPLFFKHYILAFHKDSLSNHLIAHEIVHLVNYIFLDVGIELDLINDESQAYLTGYLFKEIDEVLFNINK